MITLSLVLIPLFAGIFAFFLKGAAIRRYLLLGTSLIHIALCVLTWNLPEKPVLGGWFEIDQLGLIILSITSVLFLLVSFYAEGYLEREPSGPKLDYEKNYVFQNEPQAVFVGCLLIFFAMMTLVAISQHLGIMWVAIESTTLASAPLIYFHRHHRSLEAAWKYLLICSVGIALALLGNYFLIIAGAASGREAAPMLVAEVIRRASSLNHLWLKAAFIFFLVGYGTKMGLAPMHTWLPDAHSEAPSPISALLSGALLNCAFLILLRTHQICIAAGMGSFSSDLLLVFGLISMGWAAVFIVRQSDYKRLLAYSSVENMGILSFGAGLGGAGLSGAFLHLINHSFTKAMLFMVAGNILAACRSKRVGGVRGLKRLIPVSGWLWILGFLAISGIPPFGIFLSKFTIVLAAIHERQYLAVAFFLLNLAMIFVGMANVFPRMFLGDPKKEVADEIQTEGKLLTVPPAILLLMVLLMGLYVPSFIGNAISQASLFVAGQP